MPRPWEGRRRNDRLLELSCKVTCGLPGLTSPAGAGIMFPHATCKGRLLSSSDIFAACGRGGAKRAAAADGELALVISWWMTTPHPVQTANSPTAGPDSLPHAIAGYLSRFRDRSRVRADSDLRAFLSWRQDHNQDPFTVTRVQLELYIRWMQEIRHFKPSTVGRTVVGRGRLLRHVRDRRGP